ncbi:MAG: hypothetical protein ACI398_09825 [Clostridium sp.]
MKKSTIVVLLGGFILLTAFLGPARQERMYQKQKNFQSVDEIIQVLDTKPLLELNKDKMWGLEESDDFKECLSIRKRITSSDFNSPKLDVNEIVDLDDETENTILNYYGKMRERYSKRLPITKSKAVRLKVNGYYMSDYRTGEIKKNNNDDSFYTILDLVLIDEGEGYVIDYLNLYNSDHTPDYTNIHEDYFHSGIIYQESNNIGEYEPAENTDYDEVEDNA